MLSAYYTFTFQLRFFLRRWDWAEASMAMVATRSKIIQRTKKQTEKQTEKRVGWSGEIECDMA